RLLPLVFPVALSGIATVAAASFEFAESSPRTGTLLGLLALLAASVVAEALPVPIEGVHVGATSLATIFLAGAAVIYGWAPAALLGFLAMVIVETGRRASRLRLAYNTALYSLAAAAAGLVAHSTRAHDGIWLLLVRASLGAVAFYLVDIML